MADVLRATTIFPAFQVLASPSPLTLTLTRAQARALTLITTILSAYQDALSVHLLEVSPFMRGMQRRTLSGLPLVQGPGESAATIDKETLGAEAEAPLVWTNPKQPAAGGVRVEWLSQLEDLPEDGTPLLLLGHEFLDALPVHQLSRIAPGPQGWRERIVELPEHVRAGEAAEAQRADEEAAEAGAEAAVPTGDAGNAGTVGAAAGDAAARQRARQRGSEAAEAQRAEEEAEAAGEAGGAGGVRRQLELVLSRSRTPAAELYGTMLGAELQEAEVCPGAQRFAALVARKLASSGGAALLVDYGIDSPPASSLRGIIDHAFVDPLLRRKALL